MSRANLRLVTTPEERLREQLPLLAEAEARVRRLNMSIAANGRLLASERGVAFIRFEHLKHEFGKQEWR